MRISLLCAALAIQTIQFVTAHGDDEAPSQDEPIRACGHKKQPGSSSLEQAAAIPTTFATVIINSQANAVAAASTVAELPVADASTTLPADVAPVPSDAAAAPSEAPTSSAIVSTPSADPAPAAASSLDSAPSSAAASDSAASDTGPSSIAAPSAAPSAISTASNAASGLTADQLVAIMPLSNTCTSATPAGECLTGAQAAPLLSQSFTKYGLSNKGVQAAAVALIALESGEMKYIQHYNGASPARTGQGTYNEMSPSFVVEYAKSLYGSSAPSDAVSAMDKINSNPGDSIASASWFIQAHCGASLVSQFASDPEGAWNAYITACIFTPMTDARRSYWTKAKAAFGV